MSEAAPGEPPDEGFSTNVFVNCPFDDAYVPLLRPLLFTVVALVFTPRIATERSDSGESRLDKICGLIRRSRYSVHDLSRLKAARKGEFYRMNMPFELGVEHGARLFGGGRLGTKRSLVLEKDRYEFMKALSDLSGADVKAHHDRPEGVVRAVRDWFVETAGVRGAPSATVLLYEFTEFAADFYDARKAEGFTDEESNFMPVPEYVDFIRAWVSGGRGAATHAAGGRIARSRA